MEYIPLYAYQGQEVPFWGESPLNISQYKMLVFAGIMDSGSMLFSEMKVKFTLIWTLNCQQTSTCICTPTSWGIFIFRKVKCVNKNSLRYHLNFRQDSSIWYDGFGIHHFLWYCFILKGFKQNWLGSTQKIVGENEKYTTVLQAHICRGCLTSLAWISTFLFFVGYTSEWCLKKS